VSKVIRTGRVSGSAVTLGRAEDELYLRGEEEEAVVDVAQLLLARSQAQEAALTQQWEARLKQEHDTMRAAAERQLQEAQERHQAELEKVSQERYEAGVADGVASKEAEAREAVERVAAVHDSLKRERHQVLMEAEALVIDLAVSLARRVTGIQAEIDRKVLVKVIRGALEHLGEHDNLVIKVHAGDLQVARRFAAHWVDRVDADAVIRVVASAEVERGGCMIEGRDVNVDARLGEQIDVIEAALREAVHRPEAPGAASGAAAAPAQADAAAPDAATPDTAAPSAERGETE